MNKLEWYPKIRVMAVTAIAGCREVAGTLACRSHTVVTRRTRPGNAIVIKVGRIPCIGRMTIIALGDRLNVLGMLAGGRCAVVAA